MAPWSLYKIERIIMKFEFYVLNLSFNRNKVEMFNIFDNYYVQKMSEKAVRKYLRAPSKFKYITQYENKYLSREEDAIYGWEAFVREIDTIIAYEEMYRCEYEIAVGSTFIVEVEDILRDFDKYNSLDELKDYLENVNKRREHLEKWDCYHQAHVNIETICHTIIRQYKEKIKQK